jgi:hypothetical protein
MAGSGRNYYIYGGYSVMKRHYGLVSLGLIAALIGCSSYSVSHDYDVGADLAALRTYDWMRPSEEAPRSAEEAVERNTLIDTRVKNAVNAQLAAKGLGRDPKSPDFLVAYQISTKDKVRVKNYTFVSDKRLQTYEEGTLVLDFLAPNGKDLLWRGVARRTLDDRPTPEKTEKRINGAVEEILKGFPPK